ncbi:MAG: sugar phosphate permease [Verrucomicrobiales bacterium]|jgi:sugar phosphate permease
MPTNYRHLTVGSMTLVAILLYIDRNCMAEISKLASFKTDLGINDQQKGWILGSFYLAYAIAQVPAGMLADKFGARRMLVIYIVLWSVCTMLTGLAWGFVSILIARFIFGFAQAGCYPTSGALIRRWMPPVSHGRASSIVSIGGRIGGAIAPALTAWLLADALSWRWLLVLYGLSGFLFALFFWRAVRESPDEHPKCNEAERDLVKAGAKPESPEANPFAVVLRIVRNPTMWLMCIVQFGINIGWVFLVSWFPTYLKEVRHVDDSVGGILISIALFAGIVGLLIGGFLTDYLVKRFGVRKGRMIPMLGAYVVAMLAYVSCLFVDSTAFIVVAVATVAFMTDLSIPAIWACIMDVAGKNTAPAFGWGNMWGNLGAFAFPVLLPLVNKHLDHNGDWHEAFIFCAAGYLVASVAALGINASKKIT